MKFRAPTSFEEILVDGYMIQAEFDEAWHQATAPIDEIEFQEVANFYQVRTHTGTKIRNFNATRVASVIDGTWYWHLHYRFNIPELQAPQPYHQDLMRVARTLHGNGPGMFVPQGNDTFEVIIIDPGQLPDIALSTSLPLALAAVPHFVDLAAALTAYAGFRGELLQPTLQGFQIGQFHIDAATRALSNTMTLMDLDTDAWFLSIEGQYFLEAHNPPADLNYEIATGNIFFAGRSAYSTLIATVHEDVFRWSYFDNATPHLSSARAAAEIKRFALDHQIVDLLRPKYPINRKEELVLAAKPILGQWIHTEVQLDADTTGIILLYGPALNLPPLQRRVAEAVLHNRVPEHLNAQRALQYYAQTRQVPLDHTGRGLYFPDGTVLATI
ncbi:MAG: hypothetical protein Q3976_00490 [Corynebacterium sp.]|nr:hypothetical protein [Corynebacterium sp.]